MPRIVSMRGASHGPSQGTRHDGLAHMEEVPQIDPMIGPADGTSRLCDAARMARRMHEEENA